MAGRYLGFLTEESPLAERLSDVAWTAGVGRSHFGWRAGVVFRDEDTLRAGLRQVAEGVEGRESSVGKVAFLYGGEGGEWSAVGRELYGIEPAFREVVDRCAAALGGEGPEEEGAARYALQAGLTALWASVGVVPGVVWGCGAGELAAARASGVVDLEGGLRLATGRGWKGKPSPPEVPLVRGVSGRLEEGVPEAGAWGSEGEVRFERALETLSGLGVGLLVEVGPSGGLGERASSAWPGDGGLRVVSVPAGGGSEGWVRAVGAAYEAGLDVSFEGLFTGEKRPAGIAADVSLPAGAVLGGGAARSWGGRARAAGAAPGRAGRGGLVRDGVVGERAGLARGPSGVRGGVGAGALYAVQVLEALRETGSGSPWALEEVEIQRPLVFSEGEFRTVQVVLGSEGGFEVVSRGGSGSEWEVHAAGRVGSGAAEASEGLDLEGVRTGLVEVDPAGGVREAGGGGDCVRSGVPWPFGSVVGCGGGAGGGCAAGGVVGWGSAGASGAAGRVFPGAVGCVGSVGEEGARLPVGWERLWLGVRCRSG